MTYYKNFDVISLIKNLLMMTVLFPPAVSSSEDFINCSQIEGGVKRLDCFDRLSTRTVEVEVISNKQNSITAGRRLQERQSENNRFSITPHKPNYLLPVTYNKNLDSDIYESLDPGGTTDDKIDRFEAKFQVSFKIPLADNFLSDKSKLWFAYTQVAFWQLYNFEFSAPFRETNYEPELILSTETDFKIFSFTNSYINLALNHQSNGRAEPLSRSWNRITANFILEKDNLLLSFKPWYRIPEDDDDDNNPDIEKYLGYADYAAIYKYKNHLTTVLLRNNLRSDDNRTSIELTYTFDINKRLRGIAQYFNGYGESLIDYNIRANRFGFGILLTDWL